MGAPNVLLLDEPTVGIDEPGQERLNELVHRLQRDQGLTVLLAASRGRPAHRDTRGGRISVDLHAILPRGESLEMMMRKAAILLIGLLATASVSSQSGRSGRSGQSIQGGDNVTRATLENGLQVVIIRDPLAPVVTVEQNYLVGANETPPGFPGMAHAQEHMAFRGCAGVSADQTAAIYAQLGGYGNADTQQNITQYFTTVQVADLEVALRLDAACMQDIDDSQAEWAEEKGAIEQEVARDLSEPTYKLLTRLNEDLFGGTPYAHDALGTRESFRGHDRRDAQDVL